MDYVEKTVQKHYVFEGKIIKVRRDEAELPDGNPCFREVVEHPGGASILYVEEGKVLLVRQYRYAYGESLYEIPAGKLEIGEDPMLAAKRELEEEAGVKAGETSLFFVLYPTPGYTNEKIYIYEACNGEKTQAHLDEGEFLDVVYMPFEEALKEIAEGRIKDAKTIVALQAYALRKNKGKAEA